MQDIYCPRLGGRPRVSSAQKGIWYAFRRDESKQNRESYSIDEVVKMRCSTTQTERNRSLTSIQGVRVSMYKLS